MSKQYKTAVYIGRFQPIHKAHLETIEKALERAQSLIIFIGTDQRPCNIKNPFTTDERKEIITNAIKEHYGEELTPSWTDYTPESIMNRIKLVGCRDYLYNNYNWSSEIFSKALANGATGDKDTLLIGCMKDDSSFYLKMFPKWGWERMSYLYNLDATDIRKEFFNTGKVSLYKEYLQPSTLKALRTLDRAKELKEEFEYYQRYREDHKYKGVTAYKPIHVTVDAIVIASGCVLLIKRKFHPGKDKLAIPGGFVQQGSTLEDSMLAELKEETKIAIPKKELRKAIKARKTFDHPNRSLRGRVITTAFVIDLGVGELPYVKGDSDASGAQWIPMADAMKMESELYEDHFDMLVNMTSKY